MVLKNITKTSENIFLDLCQEQNLFKKIKHLYLLVDNFYMIIIAGFFVYN